MNFPGLTVKFELAGLRLVAKYIGLLKNSCKFSHFSDG